MIAAVDGTFGRVLVVERDAEMRRVVANLATRAGFEVVATNKRTNAVRAVVAGSPDVVVLGNGDGGRTLARIRDVSSVPVIVLSARATETDKVQALRAGADDYITGATGRREFVARVEALVRRGRQVPRRDDGFADGELEVDHAARTVQAAGHGVELTPLEYRLLTALVNHPGETLSHAQLAERVWGTRAGVGPDAVRLYVSYLRRKLGAPVRDRIETVRGFGYRYAGATATSERMNRL
ncbi:MAG: response regulator transcription factor [Actinomycetota bacterium]|nr:response regulator transcription factor [Actinomycetota bacterium]